MPLAEQHREQLDSIVQRMTADGESEGQIRRVVEDFKDKLTPQVDVRLIYNPPGEGDLTIPPPYPEQLYTPPQVPSPSEEPYTPQQLPGASMLLGPGTYFGRQIAGQREGLQQTPMVDLVPAAKNLFPGSAAMEAGAEFFSGLTTPTNLMMSSVLGPAGKAALRPMASAYFGTEMGLGAIDQAQQAHELWRQGLLTNDQQKLYDARKAATNAMLSGAMGASAGAHAVKGSLAPIQPEPSPQLEAAQTFRSIEQWTPEEISTLWDDSPAALKAAEFARNFERSINARQQLERARVTPTRPASAALVEAGPIFGNRNFLVSEARYQAALGRWRKLTTGGAALDVSAAFNPYNWLDLTEIGLYKLEKVSRKKAEWAASMVQELGKQVRPHLNKLWNDVRRLAIESSVTKEEIAKAKNDLEELAKIGIGRPVGAGLVGFPPDITNAEKLAVLNNALEHARTAGAGSRYWYERSSEATLDMMGGDREKAATIAALLAIYSQNTGVEPNAQRALRAYYQSLTGREIRGGGFGPADVDATNLLYHGITPEGIKRNNFYLNMLARILPERLASDPTMSSLIDPEVLKQAKATTDKPGEAVTVDVHEMRGFGYKSDTPTAGQVQFVTRQVRDLARRTGWEPMQVQASHWTHTKARGVMRKLMEKNEKLRAEGKPVLDVPSITNLLEESKYDFSDAFRDMQGELATETAPGKNSGKLERYRALTPEQKQRFHSVKNDVFLDENGNDLIFTMNGVAAGKPYNATGYFEGEFNPVSKVPFYAPESPQTKGGVPTGLKGTVDPAIKAQIDAASAMRGMIMEQDAAGWFRGFPNITKLSDADAVALRVGRQFTEAETREIHKKLTEQIPKDKDGDDRFALISDSEGAAILNVSDLPNEDFHKLVKKALKGVTINGDVFRFKRDGDYVKNPKGTNDAAYRQRIAAAGRPDLYQRIEVLLRAKNERADRILAREFGWDQPAGAGPAIAESPTGPGAGVEPGPSPISPRPPPQNARTQLKAAQARARGKHRP